MHFVRVGQGPPVVLLHGQPGTSSDWQWVARLIEDRFELWIPDRPGYGRTGPPAGGFAYNASALSHLLASHRVGPAVVVGHSWGGGVAIALAEQHPEQVSGLVLVCSVVPGEPAGLDDRILAAPGLGPASAVGLVGATTALLGNQAVLTLARRWLPKRLADASEALNRLAQGGVGSAWRSFLVEQKAIVEELPELERGLGLIEAPTVVINGARDRLIPAASGERLAMRMPGAERVLVGGVGHLVPYDSPETIAEAIERVAARSISNDPRTPQAKPAQTDR